MAAAGRQILYAARRFRPHHRLRRRGLDPGPARPDPAAAGRDPAIAVASGACLPGPDPALARPDPLAAGLDLVFAEAGGAQAGRGSRKLPRARVARLPGILPRCLSRCPDPGCPDGRRPGPRRHSGRRHEQGPVRCGSRAGRRSGGRRLDDLARRERGTSFSTRMMSTTGRARTWRRLARCCPAR